MADIKNRRVSLADTRQIPIVERDIQKYKLSEGDILITRVNGSADIVGQFNLCDTPGDAIYCDHFIRMRVNRQWLDPTFSALLGGSELVRQRIKDLFITTAGQKTVNQGHIGSLLFPLPPLAEQARIVARVEELMRLCDALEAKGQLEAKQHSQLVATLFDTLLQSPTPEALAENWQRVATHFDLLLDRPQAVDALEQTILQLAVRGLLVPQDPTGEPASQLLQTIRQEKDRLILEGKIKRDKPLPPIAEEEKPFEVPQGWEWVRVGNLGTTTTGGTPASNKPEYFGDEIPFIGPGQITLTGEFLPAEKSISKLGCFESSVANIGDILMVCIGGSIGKCAAATYATAFNQQINSIHPLVVSSSYVLNAMSSNDFFQIVISTATGSATPIISKGKWDLLLLPVPPLAEQARIVARVEALRRLCADLRQRLSHSQTVQAQLAKSLLASVVA